MLGLLGRYVNWLHTRWPAGTVEKLPEVREDGSTSVPGLYIVGDLTGIPLLKFSSDSGARAVQTILEDRGFQQRARQEDMDEVLDVVVVGAGVSGLAAMAEAKKVGLRAALLEASEPLSTVVNFPAGKPIFTYPTEMTPAGELQFGEGSAVKEGLVDELRAFMRQHEIVPRMARVERVRRAGGRLEVVLADGEVIAAHRVIVGIGRSGNFRKLGVPGEDLDKVSNRLHDPKEFKNKHVLIVGGGDSAIEAAIAVAKCGGFVTVSYRKPEFSRPKPDNVEAIRELADNPFADVAVEAPSSERITTASGKFLGAHRRAGSIRLMMGSKVKSIGDEDVVVQNDKGEDETIPNDHVIPAIGREAPLDFFRRSGVGIRGEWTAKTWILCSLFVLFCVFLYHWKGDYGLPIKTWFKARHWFPFNLANPADPANLFGTIRLSMQSPSFYYSFAYCLCIVIFGIKRIRRRRTPYVKWQTVSLTLIQCIPLFLLPYIVLPWMGHNATFGGRYAVEVISPAEIVEWREAVGDADAADVSAQLAAVRGDGLLSARIAEWPDLRLERSWGDRVILISRPPDGPRRSATVRLGDGRVHIRDGGQSSAALADALFPASEWTSQGREYWRSVGFILAWPLMFWNVFTHQPMMAWLVIGFVQTFVIIPLIIRKWGKGAYCGWICSCGALAETMGDAHRHKMPHGPKWNRLNMLGQVFLWIATLLLVLRVITWILPGTNWLDEVYGSMLAGKHPNGADIGGVMRYLNFAWIDDLLWAGIFGVCFYFWFSGRVWCRFACPLAALMHIYARFSRFRIIAEKKKCISCNVCTSVCHQGIDVMNFANKGLPMEDPECVRCSACVQSCPTGVLQFGEIDRGTGEVLRTDRLAASPVLMREVRINGQPMGAG